MISFEFGTNNNKTTTPQQQQQISLSKRTLKYLHHYDSVVCVRVCMCFVHTYVEFESVVVVQRCLVDIKKRK